ncbi:peptidyl-prolyl cis-trans isomerase [Trichomonascus vanleenenianus]|uniref:peptidyl-prolyl cis-trans isomerase n=1 Tax=Trichomonascus vanleenenianus TaxID=2268995 RepID=UPI003ECB0E42
MGDVFFEFSIGETNLGKAVIKLYDEQAPKLAENFRELCTGEHGFGYEGSRIHKIVPGTMVQGGDIAHGDGTAECAGIYRKGFKHSEKLPLAHDRAGLVMVNNEGQEEGSQFTITLDACPWLDGTHGVIGEVVDGMDVVRSLQNVHGGYDTVIISRSGEL